MCHLRVVYCTSEPVLNMKINHWLIIIDWNMSEIHTLAIDRDIHLANPIKYSFALLLQMNIAQCRVLL